jgi:hypothetical protein
MLFHLNSINVTLHLRKPVHYAYIVGLRKIKSGTQNEIFSYVLLKIFYRNMSGFLMI